MKFLLVFLLLAVAFPSQAGQVSMPVGTTAIQIPIEQGYARISEASPKRTSLFAALIPPQNHFLEGMMAQHDVQRATRGP